MPSRRPASGRSLAACLTLAILLTLPGGPVAAGSAAARAAVPANAPVIAPIVAPSVGTAIRPFARRSSDGDRRLRGRLKGLVRAAASGTIGSGALGGLETAAVPRGSGVAVALQLAASGGEAALDELVGHGARIANRRGRSVEAYLPPAALRALATTTGIDRAETIIRPVPLTSGIGLLGEGVVLHNADQWQAAGIRGAGIKVGIIDGGFVGLTARLGTELPPTVHARCYSEVGLYSSTAKSCEAFTDHGTAVAETIADMAPDASLYLADPVSALDLESTVAWMTSNGVKIINISLGFAFEGPGDASTPPADSVYAVVNQAVKGGALWVNAAGNSGEDGWSGTWKDADHDGLLEFSGSDESNSISLHAGDTIVVSMRWNETWGKAANDYDLYVFGPNGDFPVAASEDTQDGHGDPVESLSFTPSSSGVYRIAVQRAGGTAASRLQLLVLTSEESPLTFLTPAGTLPSPADSPNPGMISVGAVSIDAPDTVETYSSRGPTPDDRVKPDLVAADCTTTSMLNPFCGTSESSPYVAGAAALVLASRPTLTPAQLATWLRSRAIPLGSPSPNSTSGYGRLALGAPPAPPTPTSLAFTAVPSLAVAVAPLTPAPTVVIRDQDGLTLTTGAAATAPVTLALGGAPGGATLTCSGGLTQAAVAGVATFTGCTISSDGTGATLVATSGALPPVTSAPFDVLPEGSAPAPTLTTSASAAAMTWGSAVILRGTLALAAGAPIASPLAGRTIAFESSRDRSTWTGVGQAMTDATGVASLSYRPVTNLYYRATFAGAADLGAATGTSVRVTVRQTATIRPDNGGATKSVPRNRVIRFTTTVRPARSDVPPGVVTFEIWRLAGSTWRRVAIKVAQPSASGVATVDVTFTSAGLWYVRSMAAPTSLNANSTWTSRQTFRVTPPAT